VVERGTSDTTGYCRNECRTPEECQRCRVYNDSIPSSTETRSTPCSLTS